MLITFLRHATAEDRNLATADAERALTEKGEKQMKRLAAFCQEKQLLPASLYTSPILRARQTAQILHSRLPACPAPLIADWLGFDTSPQLIVGKLAELSAHGADNVWLVGHEPDFSETIAQLLHTSAEHFIIKKASLSHLDADFGSQPKAALLWSIPCALMT